MTIDHLGFAVSDFQRSRAFYLKALEPLDIRVVIEGDTWAMVGRDGRPEFWFGLAGPAPTDIHLAFTADNHDQVDRFHAAALAAGGRDNGGPGLRPHYHAHYYAAFVIDPDGNNIEAVCHAPGDAADQ